jgi:hypothetical protein
VRALWLSSLALRGIFVTAVFCFLLARGWWMARLTNRTIVAFVALYAAGLVVFPYLSIGRNAFVAFIAVLDVVLVLLVFRGDLPLYRRRR